MSRSPRVASGTGDIGLAGDGKFKFDPLALGSNSGGVGGNNGGAKVFVPRNVMAGFGAVAGASRLTILSPIAVAGRLLVEGIVVLAGSAPGIDDFTEVVSPADSPIPGVGAESKEIAFSGWTSLLGEPPMVRIG